MTVIFFVGWIPLANFLPAPSPAASAETVQQMFSENALGIRIGMSLVLIIAGLFISFGAAIAVQTYRIEAKSQPIMTFIQLPTMAVSAAIAVFCSMFWQAAAYRPDETIPEVTQALNDIAWFTFLWPWVPFSLWCVAIAIPILQDTSARPAFPRWVAFLNLWSAFLFLPAGMIVFFKDGPFAWNGLLAYYLPLFVFFIWVVAMSVSLFGAIRSQDEATATPATVG